MPQLDTLTYGSQYVYLVISFLAVYVFTVQFIIPLLVAIQKLRQKLNTVASLNSKLQRKTQAFSECNELFQSYESLACDNMSHYAKPRKPWLTTMRMAQLCQTYVQAKECFKQTLNSPSTNI